MGKIFCVMGKSPSGKDTIYNKILQDDSLKMCIRDSFLRACPLAMDRKSSGKCGQPHYGQKYPEELRHQCTKSAHLAARPPAFFVQHEEAHWYIVRYLYS